MATDNPFPDGSLRPACASDRPAEPDHPMSLEGGMVPGDAALMATCMLEELLLLGTSADTLVHMTRTPMYQALHAARCTLGDVAMDALLDEVISRVGSFHHRTHEHAGDVQSVHLSVGLS